MGKVFCGEGDLLSSDLSDVGFDKVFGLSFKGRFDNSLTLLVSDKRRPKTKSLSLLGGGENVRGFNDSDARRAIKDGESSRV